MDSAVPPGWDANLLVAPWLLDMTPPTPSPATWRLGAALIVAVALGGRTFGRFGGGWGVLAGSRGETLRLGDETS